MFSTNVSGIVSIEVTTATKSSYLKSVTINTGKQLDKIEYYTVTLNKPENGSIEGIDFGSESLRLFSSFPQFGGIVVAGDNERYVNLINMLRDETRRRKNSHEWQDCKPALYGSALWSKL